MKTRRLERMGEGASTADFGSLTGDVYGDVRFWEDDKSPEEMLEMMDKYYRTLELWFVLATTVQFQLLTVILLFWLNYVPWFGIGELGLLESLKCYLGMYEECGS